jgi:hypothetical protein
MIRWKDANGSRFTFDRFTFDRFTFDRFTFDRFTFQTKTKTDTRTQSLLNPHGATA